MRTTPVRPIHTVVALGAAAALALAACGSSSSSKSGSSSSGSTAKPTLVIGQQESGIVSLFNDSGALEGAAYNVKWTYFPFGPPLVQAAAAGQIDLGDVGDVPPIAGAAKGQGFRVIGAEEPTSSDEAGNFLIVPKGSSITTLADLRGKSVGVPEGSSAHGFLLAAVQSVGLGPDTVKFVNLAPAALQAAFVSGKLDAAAFWNPQVTLDQENGARILLAGHPPIDIDTGFYVGALKDLQDPGRRALLTDLLERLGKAYQWGDDHPDVWIKDVQKETGVDAKTASIVVQNGKVKVRYVTPDIIQFEQKLADDFLTTNQITSKVDASQIVDNILPPSFTT